MADPQKPDDPKKDHDEPTNDPHDVNPPEQTTDDAPGPQPPQPSPGMPSSGVQAWQRQTVDNSGNTAISPGPSDPAPAPTPATADWNEQEARTRLRLNKDQPAPGDDERMAYDRMVWDAEHAFHDLSAFAMIKLWTLYHNHRTRALVDGEAQKLGIDPIAAQAVLATMPSLTASEY